MELREAVVHQVLQELLAHLVQAVLMVRLEVEVHRELQEHLVVVVRVAPVVLQARVVQMVRPEVEVQQAHQEHQEQLVLLVQADKMDNQIHSLIIKQRLI
jgi:hypothetical protein